MWLGETVVRMICETMKCNNCSLTELDLSGDEMKGTEEPKAKGKGEKNKDELNE